MAVSQIKPIFASVVKTKTKTNNNFKFKTKKIMKKTLRLLSMTVLAMFASTAFAQEEATAEPTVTLDFTDTNWNFPADYDQTEKSYTNGGYTITINAPQGHKARIVKEELKGLIYGKVGSVLTLPKFDFAVEQIEVVGVDDASGKVTTNIYVGENAVSNEATGAKGTSTFIIAADAQAAGTQYVLKTTNDNNNQISAIKIYKKGEAPVVDVPKAENIAAFIALEPKTVAELTLDNAQVVYSWTSNQGNIQNFVRDASGAVQFYNDGLGLKVNQILNGTIILTFDMYKGTPEAMVAPQTNADNLTITDGEAAEPVEISTSDVANYVNDLVTIEGDFEEGEGGYFIDDVQIFNGFHVAEYETGEEEDAVDPLSKFVGGYGKVTGIVSAFTKTVDDAEVTTYEIKPIEGGIDINIEDGIESINTTTVSVNAPMYNVAGQRVSKNYKGVVVQNGKKFLNK